MSAAATRRLLHLPLGFLFAAALFGQTALLPRQDLGLTAGVRPALGSSLDAASLAARVDLAEDVMAAFQEAFEVLATQSAEQVAPPALASAAPAAVPPTQAPAPLPLRPFTYVVRRESLLEIAERFGIDVPTLLGANTLADPDAVRVGAELKILPTRGVLYQVEDGDTLNLIAARYGIETPAIQDANGLQSSELIRPGQELVLPGARPLIQAPARQEVASASQHEAAETAAMPEHGAALAAQTVRAPAPVTTSLGLLWPASGPITTYFGQVGWTSPRGHSGLDIGASWGAPVRAAAAGQVVEATRAGGGYGTMVVMQHANGLRTLYGHLSQLNVQAGEQVQRGELIGLVGSTGFSTGPHLHFEVTQGGARRDPLDFLP